MKKEKEGKELKEKKKRENERKDLEEREKITQESNLEIQSQVVKLKIISNAKRDLNVKDLVLNLSLLYSL